MDEKADETPLAKKSASRLVTSQFECALCDYRSLEKDTVSVHFKAYHVEHVPPRGIKKGQNNLSRISFRMRRAQIPGSDTLINLAAANRGENNVWWDPSLEEIEKLSTNALRTASILGLYGSMGKPINNRYSCPFCNKFKTIRVEDFTEHLYLELGYPRYICSSCGVRSVNYDVMMGHLDKRHTDCPVPVVQLVTNSQIEDWIGKVNLIQTRLITETTVAAPAKSQPKPESKPLTDVEESACGTSINQDVFELKCNYCAIVCSKRDEMEHHWAVTHKDHHLCLSYNIVPKARTARKRNMKYRCPQTGCTYSSDSYKSSCIHLRGHVKPYYCKHCGACGIYPFIIKKHHKKKHSELQLKCLRSEKGFAAYRKLLYDMLELHDKNSKARLDLLSAVSASRDIAPRAPAETITNPQEEIKTEALSTDVR